MYDFFSHLWNSGGGPYAMIFDFIIVFYLFYVILLLVRGTRSVPMFLGLLVIWIIYTISRDYGLSTTYVLLDQFMEVAVICALIIFQDDIRRALVRVGRFARIYKAKESKVVEEVIRGASSLASRRMGAIIVFEREGSLSEFIEAGTNLDATVTKELLYAIFIPRMENPLHDGAVILKNYRIREAGALLPLSTNQRLDKTMGTRHRAALGITEMTDAVAVVVSEERGTISVCYDGRMRKNLDDTSLRKTLRGLFAKEKNRPYGKSTSTKTSEPPSGPDALASMPDTPLEGNGEGRPLDGEDSDMEIDTNSMMSDVAFDSDSDDEVEQAAAGHKGPGGPK